MRGGGNVYTFPGLKGKRDLCGSGSGGFGDPNRAMKVHRSTPAFDFKVFLDWRRTSFSLREDKLRDWHCVVRDGGFVSNPGKRTWSNSRRTDDQEQFTFTPRAK